MIVLPRKSRGTANSYLIIFAVLSAVWIFLFRDFLSGKLALIMDAGNYYGEFKFYIDNITQGVYPLWNPTKDIGSPNDLFLRRICPYNPFLLVIIILNNLGLPYRNAYLGYLAFYFFLGMGGFYLVSKRLFCDKTAALFSFAALLFSSLGTRLFDSFVVFIFVPLIWFFYFLISFSYTWKKYDFLGMVFSLMIVVTTYIPFHSLTVLLVFFLSYAVCYSKDMKRLIPQFFRFIKTNKIFIVFCMTIFILALLPGVLFYTKANQGEFVMPLRQNDTNIKNALTVDRRGPVWWAILEEMIYSKAFWENLSQFQLQVFYVPIFIFLIFVIGSIVGVNRRVSFFALWGFLLFLLSVPETFLYRFFSTHVFYFKYFKNLQFFLWIGILPIFILFVTEQFRLLLIRNILTQRKRLFFSVYLLLIHGSLAFFIFRQGDSVASSYLVIVLSLLFFILYLQKKIIYGSIIFLILLFICIILQPVAVYTYLGKNAEKAPEEYPYDQSYLKSLFTRGEKNTKIFRGNDVILPNMLIRSPVIYFGTRRYYFLLENLNPYVLTEYVRQKFKVYDRIEWVKDDSDIAMKRVESMFLKNENTALVSAQEGEQGTQVLNQNDSTVTQPIEGNSSEFQVMSFDANSIKFKTRFGMDKFLVYNDNFYSGWRAFINGKEVKLWRANIAFKGIFLPKGENVVYLRFGAMWYYVFNFFLIGVFYSVFFYLLWGGTRSYWARNKLESGKA